MHIESYLRNFLNKKIKDCEVGIRSTKELLRVLEQTNIDEATYIVHFKSLWEDDGEESTRTEYRGTLKDAMERAETEFKSTNRRSDVQADCSVNICLGDNQYQIPKAYWEKFRKRYGEV
ncbi:MAG: hypothetical protein DRP06_04355 [Candidatus Aenigmatarchaeota archaeon]|nr:MAG: hypothetical protein DRP06_04355 [Candidatus Aenigmarchaeota archaeon]